MSRRVNALRVRLQQEREARELAAWGEGGTFEDESTPSCFCGAALSHPPELCCFICRAATTTPAIAPVSATRLTPARAPRRCS